MKLFFTTLFMMIVPAICIAQTQDADPDSDNVVTGQCVCVPIDNCPNVYNPLQLDCDSDGAGNACDETDGCIDTDTGVDTDTGIEADTETDTYIIENCTPLPTGIFSELDTSFILSTLNDGYVQQNDVFMVVGDSISSGSGLGAYYMGNCAHPEGAVENVYGWIGVRDSRCYPEISDSMQFFNGGNAYGGDNAYLRYSLAAHAGWTATTVMTGNPSPLQQEIDAINPQYAQIMFGSNDVYGIDATVDDAPIDDIVDDIMDIAYACANQGVIPIVFSPPSRVGYEYEMELLAHRLGVATYDAGIPFVDFYAAAYPLNNHGAGSDGTHPSVWTYNRTCVFNSYGLQYGYNMLNLVASKMLSNVLGVVNQ